MNIFKKLSVALIFAVVAVFSATAAEKCDKACAKAQKGCPVQITRDNLKAQGAYYPHEYYLLQEHIKVLEKLELSIDLSHS